MTVTAAPAWQATSVTWLEQNHAHYLSGTGRGRPASERLERALLRMCFGKVDAMMVRGKSQKDYETFTKNDVASWGKFEHNAMCAFLNGGGYDVEFAKIKKTLPAAQKLAPAIKDLEEVDANLSPPSEHPQDLDEAIAAEAERLNPQAGRW